ncbi:variant erythrocyte surface antigen-1 beta subunit [Babesia bovis T2Bo]|uniref:Variant erythrocyte surface antigen-1, beta subunit n=1 Tax=Babesia bovis TaxID=5865 RepID=A7AQV6_BABBO|nr:variant erythrocyte surface antigen-1 beta subunit [Babesia bovis T2Bo]EDO06925.1 variant erythrocyte surface antigen-1 beta subunit [Babesia bovis T2Bo]|eukprot:XP_001610493.1 variant erythrocyte surface antigen-1, beta subunit [Babesia bovis T2Bo]
MVVQSNTSGESKGTGKKCKHGADAADGKCCNKNGTPSGGRITVRGTDCVNHECKHCGISPGCEKCTRCTNKCHLSAYSKSTALWTTIVNANTGKYPLVLTVTGGIAGSSTTNNDPSKVHLLARIFLGSVCLIWSGLSQLGFLTGKGGDQRWREKTLTSESEGLGSFMAAMGYDLERLNQGGKYSLG